MTAEADPAHARAGGRLHEQAGDADAAAQDAALEPHDRERAHQGRRRRRGRRGRRRRRDRRGRQRAARPVTTFAAAPEFPPRSTATSCTTLAARRPGTRRHRRPEGVEHAVAVEVPQRGGQAGRARRGADGEARRAGRPAGACGDHVKPDRRCPWSADVVAGASAAAAAVEATNAARRWTGRRRMASAHHDARLVQRPDEELRSGPRADHEVGGVRDRPDRRGRLRERPARRRSSAIDVAVFTHWTVCQAPSSSAGPAMISLEPCDPMKPHDACPVGWYSTLNSPPALVKRPLRIRSQSGVAGARPCAGGS